MASRAGAAIESRFGVAPALVPGMGGIFLVTVDGKTVVTNEGRCGPLPTPDEVVRAIVAACEEAEDG